MGRIFNFSSKALPLPVGERKEAVNERKEGAGGWEAPGYYIGMSLGLGHLKSLTTRVQPRAGGATAWHELF